MRINEHRMLELLRDPRGPYATMMVLSDPDLRDLLDALFRYLATSNPAHDALIWYEIGSRLAQMRPH